MLFNSVLFVFCFLPIFFTIYFLLPERFKNAFALLASIAFYAWGAPRFVLVLSGAVLCDFVLAKVIAAQQGKARNYWLAFAIAVNLSVLLYFKYFNFFAFNFAQLFNTHSPTIQMLLPIGISFFTFHEISYLTDVYRKTRQPFTNLINYALYIFLFPQLIAGPIIRFHQISGQIENRSANHTAQNQLTGFFRFVAGLAKKVLIADVIGIEVDKIFAAAPETLGTGIAWLGAVLNIVRIYIDFSGYSDMAIGLALAMGFKFPENFNSPLIAQSVTEFWQRWHISLTNWFRDYVFIPLGGSKGTLLRTCLNILLVFVLSGFWHGAQWKFVAWGLGFGLVVALERYFSFTTLKISAPLKVMLTFFICANLLVVFTSASISASIKYFGAMYSTAEGSLPLFLSLKTKLAIALALLISFGSSNSRLNELAVKLFDPQKTETGYIALAAATIGILVVCGSMLFVAGYHPFLYFKF
ncbi:MAG: MBOAT family protein [Chitinophagales bacterium]|jgi:alginate O-acetyltransferase complex protein AlgI|nr:MBOAT family protein [Chitinophagales bacterium]